MTPTLPALTLKLPTEAATTELAARLSRVLIPGDCLLLSGPIGSGKSTFARALIRARLGNPAEEVPSPTFTLVQTYDSPLGDLWHCDLYRLTSPDEAIELGLDQAFETAICIVEWPGRLGSLTPATALGIEFAAGTTAEEGHSLTLTAPPEWQARLEAILA